MRRLGVCCITMLVVSGILAGCSPKPREVLLDLILRTSCRDEFAQFTAYDITCVEAVEVRLVSGAGEPLAEQCTDIRQLGLSSIQDLVTIDQLVPVLEDVNGPADVRVEIRGYHGFDLAPCDNPTNDELIFWGSSEVVDLSEQSNQLVTLELECRPECDCAEIVSDPATCPINLVPGVCAPVEDVPCRKMCVDDEQCYGGLLECSPATFQCTPSAFDSLCADCTAAGDCASGACVLNTTTTERFCADPCPSPTGSQVCPSRMSCKRLGNGVFEPQP